MPNLECLFACSALVNGRLFLVGRWPTKHIIINTDVRVEDKRTRGVRVPCGVRERCVQAKDKKRREGKPSGVPNGRDGRRAYSTEGTFTVLFPSNES